MLRPAIPPKFEPCSFQPNKDGESMNCPSCAAPCPDGAKFCPSCGYSLPREESDRFVVEVVSRQIRWETSQIYYDQKSGTFWAKALGEGGEYIAGESYHFSSSDEIPSAKNKNVLREYQTLVDQLLMEGWNHTGRASVFCWYSDTFRREAQRENQGIYEYCEIYFRRLPGFFDNGVFEAKVHGPRGTYVEEVSDKLERYSHVYSPEESSRIFGNLGADQKAKLSPFQSAIVHKLLESGWEVIESASTYPWYRTQLRRRIS